MTAARALEQAIDGSFEVTLVTRHPWSPVGAWLPAIAAGSMDPRLATAPIRPMLQNSRLLLAEVMGVDPLSRLIQLGGREVQAGLAPASLPYDDLIVALGATPIRRGPALSFSHFPSAIALRERLLQALWLASSEESPRKRKLFLSVAILGSDEIACSLAGEIFAALRAAVSFWPRIELPDIRVLLICPGELLPGTPNSLSSAVKNHLQTMGVEIHSHAICSQLADDHIVLSVQGKEERIEIRTVLSLEAAEAPPCLGTLRSSGGLLSVEPSLVSSVFPGFWAIGACMGAPPLLEDRRAQALRCVRNLLAQAQGKPLESEDRVGSLRTVALAPNEAVGTLRSLPLPSAIVGRFRMFQELRRWWPGAAWLAMANGRSVPGLMASMGGAVPEVFETPLPKGVQLASLSSGEGATSVGFPFTMPLPPSSGARH